jgi:predicted RecB family nuclease
MEALQAEYKPKATEALLRRCKLDSAPTALSVTIDDLKQGHPLILDCTVETDQFQFNFDALKKLVGKSSFGSLSYQPVMFHHEDSAKERQKLLLACGGHVLGQVQGKQPETGLFVFGTSFRTTTVKPPSYSKKLQSLLADSFTMSEAAAPTFFLNDHCEACEFKETCHGKAVDEDHLSLLRRMTENQANKLRRKGIFTVYQLSHTFRPRRKSKRHRHLGNPHSFALQALAIRENKIHVVGVPELPETPVRFYVDVEGDSDGRFIYLIGLLIDTGTAEKMHSLWADTKEQEAAIFEQLLGITAEYEDFSLFHFGNYELAFFKRIREHTADRSLADRLIDRSCNVLSLHCSENADEHRVQDCRTSRSDRWPDNERSRIGPRGFLGSGGKPVSNES